MDKDLYKEIKSLCKVTDMFCKGYVTQWEDLIDRFPPKQHPRTRNSLIKDVEDIKNCLHRCIIDMQYLLDVYEEVSASSTTSRTERDVNPKSEKSDDFIFEFSL